MADGSGLMRIVATGAAMVGLALVAPPALADAADAKAVVKAMADYLAKQTNLHFTFDTNLDVVTDELQRVTFASSGEATLSRPGKIRLSRQGGYTDLDLISDGKTVTLSGNKAGVYAQADAPASLAELVDKLSDLGITSPASDLFGANAFDELTGSTTDGKVVGTGVIDGKECTHLAFRAPDVDWQLWVRTGDSPLPCQYVITTKHVAQAPQYAIRFSGWSTDAPAADAFIFTPPSGAKKVSLDELKGIDELPDAADEGDTQ